MYDSMAMPRRVFRVARTTVERMNDMAQQQTTVTITGFVGSEPTRFGREDAACSFRIGSTRSYYQAASKQWVDQPTTWISVKAFRALATNVCLSVHKGDPVMVTGVLGTEEWVQDGNRRSRLVVEASSVGHDLSLGRSQFTRIRSGNPPVAGSGGSAGLVGSAGTDATVRGNVGDVGDIDGDDDGGGGGGGGDGTAAGDDDDGERVSAGALDMGRKRPAEDAQDRVATFASGKDEEFLTGGF